MSARRLILVALALGACGEGAMVDVDKNDVVGYEDWKRVDVWGPVGGHGDSYRIIYANNIAEQRISAGGGRWPDGAVIVKEIRDRDGDDPGDLRYIGVMRRMTEGDAPDGAELHRTLEGSDSGWLFTYLADDIDSDEEYRESCWSDCHVAAPFGGAFLDYAE